MLQSGGIQDQSDKWSITSEERQGYDRQFDQLGGVGGYLRGDQVRPHFFRSNLPAPTLGQIWELADFTKDGKMDRLEFAIAMKLIKLKLQGNVLPKTLPASMKKQTAKFDISSFAQTSLNTGLSTTKEEVSLLSSMSLLPKAVSVQPAANSFSSANTSHAMPAMGNNAAPNAYGNFGGMSALPPGMGNTGGFATASMLSGTGMSGSNVMMGVGSTGSIGMHSIQGLGMSSAGVTPMSGMTGTTPMYTMPTSQSMPMQNTAQITTPTHSSFVPNSAPTGSPSFGSEWAVPKPSKLKYNQLFNSHDVGKTGFVSGMAARHLLKQTGLPEPMLAQIWNLSDIDKDGRLTQEEFVLAMHLTDTARSGAAVPPVLPAELVPPSYRRNAANAPPVLSLNNTDALANMENLNLQDKPAMSLATFEDRRRDNFNKGNIELEKRRLALLEQQRKEQERLEKKEREQRERRERERREQEMRRQAELERQIEMQQAAEREREEARRKAIEQREAAQRELERQTRLEFERVKRQELLHQKLREQEAVTSLHAKTKELDVEITTLNEKKDQLQIRVSDLDSREKDQKAALDTMEQSRHMKSSQVARRQEELKDLNNKLDRLQPEKQELLDRMRDGNNNENYGDSSFYKSNIDLRQRSLSELKASVEKQQSESASRLIEFKKLNIQLNDLREELNRHNLEVEAMNRVQQDKVRELQEARRAKESSLMRKDSTERIKMRHKSATESIPKVSVRERKLQIQDQLQTRFNSAEKPKAADPFASSELKSNNDFFGKAQSQNFAAAFPPSAASGSDPFGGFGSQNGADPFANSAVSGDAFGSDPFADNKASVTADVFGQAKMQSDVEPAESAAMTEEEIKRENVKKKIAEMQQKRLEQKRLQQDTAPKPVPKDVRQTSQENLTKFQALYDFSARNADELTLKTGDIVMVNEKEDTEPGWYSGAVNNRKGLFPANYVEKVAANASNTPKGIQIPPPTIREPTQSSASNSSNSANADAIHSKEKSAFTLTGAGRHMDSSPIPGQGEKISDFKCRALYPWKAKKENHLTFEQDAIIEVTEQQAMWWFGSTNGKTGWFPKSYVRQVSAADGRVTAKAPEPVPKIKAPAPSAPGKQPGKEYIATYAFTSLEPGDLSFDASEVILVTEKDGDWWKGTAGNRSGIFPANYVSPKPEAATPAAAASSAPSSREIADVVAAYDASDANQLSLKVGQLVLVRKKSDAGWWEGELQARGKKKQVGWFPANYVKLRTPNLPKPKTICRVMAMYDYAAQNDDEISFSRGSVVSVVDKADADWWKGSAEANPDACGLFPKNYVKEMTHSESGSNLWTAEQKAMNPQEIRRQQHIHELIASEETYLKDLEMADSGFQTPLRKQKLLTDQELSTLFANWDELITCSDKLVKEAFLRNPIYVDRAFRVRKKHSGDGGPGAIVSLIGDVLCQHIPHLQPYIRFCSCQLNASSLLQEKINNDAQFKKFVKQCESGNKFRGLPVSSYLVKPMQRITKYPLLIEKILKFTPEDHADHGHLKLALERAEEICFNVNEGVRQKENADRLEWLQSHINIDALDKLVFNSATNCLGQRRFLHCGTLYKHKSNKELVGFLFNDFLLLTTPTKPLNAPVNDFIFSSKTNFQFRIYKMPIFLNEVLIRLPTDPSPTGGNDSTDEDVPLFHVSHVDRVYTLRAENINERTAWTTKIRQASQIYVETEKQKREKAYQARSQRTAGIGRLMVVIVEGCNLVKGGSGRNDPYCEVNMGAQSHTTKTIQDTTNPKWGTSMQFFIKDIMEDVLCISVFQRDMFSPDNFLGRTEMRVADIRKQMKSGKGPLTRRLLLHEVESGEVVVKVDLQLFDKSRD